MAKAPQYVFLSSISEAKIQISVEMTCSFLRQFAGNTISAIYTARSISISVVKKSIAIAISVTKFITQLTVGFYFREFTEIAINFVNISIYCCRTQDCRMRLGTIWNSMIAPADCLIISFQPPMEFSFLYRNRRWKI